MCIYKYIIIVFQDESRTHDQQIMCDFLKKQNNIFLKVICHMIQSYCTVMVVVSKFTDNTG